MLHTILRIPKIVSESGLSRSTIYSRAAEGLWPKLIKLGPRSVGQPASEVSTMNAAHISGKSEEEIRVLVLKLESARKSAE